MQNPAIRPVFHPAVLAWALLMLATAVSWWLGSDHGLVGDAAGLAVAIIAVVAFVKVYLVGMYFMELRHAPRVLRLAFNAWVVLTCLLVTGLYIAASS